MVSVQPETPDRAQAPVIEREPIGARAARYGRRTILYTWLTVVVVAGILFIILIVENTRRVKVGWVFGYSHVSLVFLVIFAALIGWALGLATGSLIRHRTRAPLTAQERRRD